MVEDPLRTLAEQLRATPPEGLRALTPDQIRELADAIRDARHRQAAQLEAAGEQAFSHLPRLLRGPIRKVLG